MPRPERKGAGLISRTGKKSRMERSLVEECSQHQHGWLRAKRINILIELPSVLLGMPPNNSLLSGSQKAGSHVDAVHQDEDL